MVMNVLQTHPRVLVNGIIIPNPHYVPPRQFLEILHACLIFNVTSNPAGQPAGGGGDVVRVDAGPGE
jgi:hypothetical protein